MIEKAATVAANFIVRNNPQSEELYDIYKYGIEITVSSALNIILILLISILFNSLFDGLVFLTVFIPIRQYTGGYHADSYFKCNTSFCISFIALLIINKYIDITFTYMLISIAFFTVIIGFTTPVENKNKPIDMSKRKKYKLKSVILFIAMGFINVMLFLLGVRSYRVIFLTLWIITLLAVVPYIKKGGEKNEKNIIKCTCEDVGKDG